MKKQITFYIAIFLLIVNLFLGHAVLAYESKSEIQHTINKIQSYDGLIQTYSPINANYPKKEIVISLTKEELTAYDGSKIFLQTPVTTGGPETPTPIGTFNVQEKLQNFTMKSPWPPSDSRWYPDTFINYGLLFETGGFYIHDASWRGNFGPGSNSVDGIPGGSFTGSHGCVNVPLNAEAALYEWAPVGTTVIVEQ